MEWRNSGMDITINLHIMEIYALQEHVHGNLCLARARAWKFMPCKGMCMEIYALQGCSYH